MHAPGKSLSALMVAGLAAMPLSAAEWDFTGGVPEGCAIREFAVLSGEGLSPRQLSDTENCPAGAVVSDAVLPEGAFTFEAEFVPYLNWDAGKDRDVAEKPGKSTIEERFSRQHVLWDSMAGDPGDPSQARGFRIFCEEGWIKRWTPRMHLSIGGRVVRVSGPVIEPRAGELQRLTVSFDGMGCVEWNFSGRRATSYFNAVGGVCHGGRTMPVIGDSAAPRFSPPNASIRRVALVPRERERFLVQPDGRLAFERGEKNAVARLRCGVSRHVSKVDMSVREMDGDGNVFARFRTQLGALDADTFGSVGVPVETRLACGRYVLDVVSSVSWRDGGASVFTQRVGIAVGPVFAERMPVVMWGVDGYDEAVGDFGFTHGLDRFSGVQSLDCGDTDDERRLVGLLDRAMGAGIKMMKAQSVLYPEGEDPSRYHRAARGGGRTPHKFPQPEVSHPDMLDYAVRIARLEHSIMSGHPAFGGVLPCSEWRDRTFPSFNTEHLRYERETGLKVPPEVSNKKLDPRIAERLFPDGVVPDEHPILSYYRWFWRGGDGWPGYVGAIADVYSGEKGRDFFTFWDPAVRCPPIWGSGGSVQALSHWVYAQPEPMNVAGPAEEVIAMADGRRGQLPMIMTQLICYRAQLAPKSVRVAPLPEWMKRIPEATFPTIPADALQEALWSMIAKPVKGVMFYGWGNIYDTGSTRYAYTSPDTARTLRHLLKNVVAPLGPTLKHLGRETPQVAVLESFTSAALGGPGSWGWRSPAITFMQCAGLDPRVIYEDTIARDGFGPTKLLYAPDCMFLSASTVKAVREFQRNGGILVADGRLLKALEADIEVPIMAYAAPPKTDSDEEMERITGKRVNTAARAHTMGQKQKMLEAVGVLRARLSEKCGYRPVADRSNPDIAVYSRAHEGVRYLFAVNDRRTFGDYVGQWGLTMDKGMPCEGTVSLADVADGVGAVYELSRGGEIGFSRSEDSRIVVPLKFDTNDGRMLVFLPRRIADVEVETSKDVCAGEDIHVTMRIKDESGSNVPALLPVEIRISDASGRELDGAGYACASNGVCRLSVKTNINDPRGGYSVVCRDRASGIEVRRTVSSR